MATPKKKISRSRRNMRRFSAAYELDTITLVPSEEGGVTRPHRVTRETAAAYVAARNQRRAAKRAAPSAAK